MSADLSADEARRLAVHAQLLSGPKPPNVSTVLKSLGAIQLDTISVLARSHELVAYARLGPVGRAAVEAAYWGRPHRAFEYWAHAMCILPIEEWPYFEARRRIRRRWTHPRRPHDTGAMRQVLRLLRASGPITTDDLGGSRSAALRPGDAVWWNWSPLKIAIERLLSTGEVVCVERRGWRRVYDLAERVIPARLLRNKPSDAECHAHLIARAAKRLGVATLDELADYFGGIYLKEVPAAIDAAGLVPVTVEGWKVKAWGDRAALRALAVSRARGSRTTLLSPFDSLIWSMGRASRRARTTRIFGFAHVFEAYVPVAKRQHGYFSMPLLADGKLVGHVDPGRDGATLVAKGVRVEPAYVGHMATALREAASWVGCTDVAIGERVPRSLARRLRAELRD